MIKGNGLWCFASLCMMMMMNWWWWLYWVWWWWWWLWWWRLWINDQRKRTLLLWRSQQKVCSVIFQFAARQANISPKQSIPDHITHLKYSELYKYTIVKCFGGLSVFIAEEWQKCLRKKHLFDKSWSRDKNELYIGKLGMKFVTRSDFNLKSVKETKSLISFVFHCHFEIRLWEDQRRKITICHAILETKSYMVSQKILPIRDFSISPYPWNIHIGPYGAKYSLVVRSGT